MLRRIDLHNALDGHHVLIDDESLTVRQLEWSRATFNVRMKFKSLALALALSLASVLPASSQPADQITGDSLAAALQTSGLPVSSIVVYTGENDPNRLLGRPGQYTGKVSWHDDRARPHDDPESTVELFATFADLDRRAKYLDAIISSSSLFGQYMYRDDDRLALLRVPFDLTPDQAPQYQAWLAGLPLVAPGAGASRLQPGC